MRLNKNETTFSQGILKKDSLKGLGDLYKFLKDMKEQTELKVSAFDLHFFGGSFYDEEDNLVSVDTVVGLTLASSINVPFTINAAGKREPSISGFPINATLNLSDEKERELKEAQKNTALVKSNPDSTDAEIKVAEAKERAAQAAVTKNRLVMSQLRQYNSFIRTATEAKEINETLVLQANDITGGDISSFNYDSLKPKQKQTIDAKLGEVFKRYRRTTDSDGKVVNPTVFEIISTRPQINIHSVVLVVPVNKDGKALVEKSRLCTFEIRNKNQLNFVKDLIALYNSNELFMNSVDETMVITGSLGGGINKTCKEINKAFELNNSTEMPVLEDEKLYSEEAKKVVLEKVATLPKTTNEILARTPATKAILDPEDVLATLKTYARSLAAEAPKNFIKQFVGKGIMDVTPNFNKPGLTTLIELVKTGAFEDSNVDENDLKDLTDKDSEIFGRVNDFYTKEKDVILNILQSMEDKEAETAEDASDKEIAEDIRKVMEDGPTLDNIEEFANFDDKELKDDNDDILGDL